MVGITSYGAYIPRLRLNRMSIFQSIGWFSPAIVTQAQGERSFCNHDEDAITMAVAAARDCLIGKDKGALGGLYLCSTTLPYLDRLNAGIVSTALNLKPDLVAADITASQKAGTTGIITALDVVKAGSKNNILVTVADNRLTKPASMYEMWFGDGAAAVIVGTENVIAEFKGSYSINYDFVDHYRGAIGSQESDYIWEERWLREEGYSKFIPEAVGGLFKKLGITMADVDKLIFPCLFAAAHRDIAKGLGATPEKLVDTMHAVTGEMGVAHTLIMFASVLEQAKPGDRVLVCGFGQGCDALYFVVTENIAKLAKRIGVKGSLENKKVVDNYTIFLKFRNQLLPELGIRAESPTQTAMSALWRNRKAVYALVGGKCTACGTPQYPKSKICVNPRCGKFYTQEDYEFADVPARIKTFTADMLAASDEPPVKYGMVQFEGGGRHTLEFTDCDVDEVKVGLPVTFSFRRKYADKQRGFTGYFWKAVPVKGAMAEIRFDGKVAIITGAGAGLGRAYALELAKRGAKVVVNDLGGTRDGTGASSSAADAVVAEIKAAGGESVANYDNVATPEGGENIVNTAVKAFGTVDILINNAGILRDKSFLKMEPENWDAVMNVHLYGAYCVTKPAFKIMRDKGYGRIVMTTSAAGLYGNFGQTNYSSAKMGLVGFMNVLKLEGAKYNIKVNTIAPMAASRLTEDVMTPDMFQQMKPEFIVPAVLWFCAEEYQDSGVVINAALSYFNRAAFMTGPGAKVGDGKTLPTVEDIKTNWDKINSLDGAKYYFDSNAAIGDFMSGAAIVRPDAPAAGGAPTVKDIFAQMAGAFNAEAAKGVDIVFQYVISGPMGGSWKITVKDGTCKVEEGTAEKPTTTIKMVDEDFIQLITGKLDGMKAFSSGKLKVEGDMMKSQLIAKLFPMKV